MAHPCPSGQHADGCCHHCDHGYPVACVCREESFAEGVARLQGHVYILHEGPIEPFVPQPPEPTPFDCQPRWRPETSWIPGLAKYSLDSMMIARCRVTEEPVGYRDFEVPPYAVEHMHRLHVVCRSCGIVDHRSPDGKICAHCGDDLAVFLNRHDLRDMLEAGLVRTKETVAGSGHSPD